MHVCLCVGVVVVGRNEVVWDDAHLKTVFCSVPAMRGNLPGLRTRLELSY